MPLVDTLNNYRTSIAEIQTFIADAYIQDAHGNYIVPKNQREFIADSAFLRFFIAWETFIEDSFLKYMLGELSILGHALGRYVTPAGRTHADAILRGIQQFVDWSDPGKVRKLANLHFTPANPFDVHLGAIYSDLLDLKTVRNAAAHMTSTTQTKLDALATGKLGTPQVNTKVSDLILAVDPHSASHDTVLITYLGLLDVAAELIANG